MSKSEMNGRAERRTNRVRTRKGSAKDVILYNRTKLPDDVLLPLLVLAKTLSGADGEIVAKVDARSNMTSYAMRGNWVDEDFLLDRRWKRQAREEGASVARRDRRTRRADAKQVRTTGGYTVIRVRADRRAPLDAARQFFETAIHEFAHIRDYQQNAPFVYYAPGSDRKLPHRKRPHEIRAANAVYDAWETVNRSPVRRRQVDAMLGELATVIGAAYPQKSEEQRQIERNRRFHNKDCRNGNCWYCRYLRERSVSTVAPVPESKESTMAADA